MKRDDIQPERRLIVVSANRFLVRHRRARQAGAVVVTQHEHPGGRFDVIDIDADQIDGEKLQELRCRLVPGGVVRDLRTGQVIE